MISQGLRWVQQRRRYPGVRLHRAAKAALIEQDQFLEIAAHELRTPLTVVVGYAQYLQGSRPPADDLEERALAAIVGSSRRLARLIDSLTTVARLHSGHIILRTQPVDLVQLAEQVVFDLRPMLVLHEVALEVATRPALIAGDLHLLEQVLFHLVWNGIRFSPRGGRVIVRVGRTAGDGWLSVTDHGLGLSAEDLRRVFQRRFYRVDRQVNAQGIGIGLYVVKALTERHGGAVEARSAVGQGSTFTVRLPLL